MHWLARVIGAIGAWVIYRLIALFGRIHAWRDIAWLEGPLGDDVIGDAPYRDVAARLGLTVERDARDGGLVPDFAALRGEHCDPDRSASGSGSTSTVTASSAATIPCGSSACRC